jgi:phenylacetate-CoA ligase
MFMPYQSTADALSLLSESQWWPAKQMEAFQLDGLRRVVQDARQRVPFYRRRLNCVAESFPDSMDQWRSLPLLTRFDIQSVGADLHSTAPPLNHHPIGVKYTSGSTGIPVAVLSTPATESMWRAMTLRDHLWHGRDFSKKLGAIRWFDNGIGSPPAGSRVDNWGTATKQIATGPCAMLSIQSTTAEQLDWLLAERPDYLLSYPSAIENLLHYYQQNYAEGDLKFTEVRTFGEVLSPRCRRLCESVWQSRLADLYSSEEVGYIALQCAETKTYHSMSEDLIVEVIDADGEACPPGEVGRVVITTLNNYASPLLRYEIGDYAQVGDACRCGRGLPVIERIWGRSRNMFTLPSGETLWPSFQFQAGDGMETLPVRQFQAVQTTTKHVEVSLVTMRALSRDEEDLIRASLLTSLRYPFSVSFNYVECIPRSPTGKFEDFKSLVTGSAHDDD